MEEKKRKTFFKIIVIFLNLPWTKFQEDSTKSDTTLFLHQLCVHNIWPKKTKFPFVHTNTTVQTCS